jgi:wyosine [tRNA(Phe)-imidazoG37] synthetase (radical SAM superfamily)
MSLVRTPKNHDEISTKRQPAHPANNGVRLKGLRSMAYVFGPVPSRRLGQSLGIDTIPLKTCNWNCVYCQLGRTLPVTNERKEYIPRQAILAEVGQALRKRGPGEIDWLTFVGSGEPTLHDGIGWLIRQVKQLTDLPLAVITNGALLYQPEVRQELMAADAVMPTLDAGTPALYRRINRPHPEVTFERLVDGLIAFRHDYQGNFWPEVMLVRGLNDTEEALRAIAAVFDRVEPDEIHISLPTRPPAETWVEAPDEEGLMRARAILGDVARVIHPAEGSFDLGGYANPTDALVSIITRHPMSEEEILRTLERWSPGKVRETLAELADGGRAQMVQRYGLRFWSATPARYPDPTQSLAADPRRRQQRRAVNEDTT